MPAIRKKKPIRHWTIAPKKPPICSLCGKAIVTLKMGDGIDAVDESTTPLATCLGGYVHRKCDEVVERARIPNVKYPTESKHDRYEKQLVSFGAKGPFTICVKLPGLEPITQLGSLKYIRDVAKEAFRSRLELLDLADLRNMTTSEEDRGVKGIGTKEKYIKQLLRRIS